MKQKQRKTIVFGVLMGALFMLCLTVLAAEINTIMGGYRSHAGNILDAILNPSYSSGINAFSDTEGGIVCGKVSNIGTMDYFVPTNTGAEWDAFRSATTNIDDLEMISCCVSNYQDECGATSCKNAGAINCTGSCLGVINKVNGTPCGGTNTCTNGLCCSSLMGQACGTWPCATGTYDCGGTCVMGAIKYEGTACTTNTSAPGKQVCNGEEANGCYVLGPRPGGSCYLGDNEYDVPNKKIKILVTCDNMSSCPAGLSAYGNDCVVDPSVTLIDEIGGGQNYVIPIDSTGKEVICWHAGDKIGGFICIDDGSGELHVGIASYGESNYAPAGVKVDFCAPYDQGTDSPDYWPEACERWTVVAYGSVKTHQCAGTPVANPIDGTLSSRHCTLIPR